MKMELTINKVYPWGRSFDEYRQMFGLTDADLTRRILGCADGPASFNAEMHQLGRKVVSCDPLYKFDTAEINGRIDCTRSVIMDHVHREFDRYNWNVIKSPDELAKVRMSAMEEFLSDYEPGRRSGRYVVGSLPNLPFADRAFDLALCSHYLFLYSDDLSAEQHQESIEELCRVANEVRLFPLVDRMGNRSRHVKGVMTHLRALGFEVNLRRVTYDFQKGGDEMMQIFHSPRGVG